MAKATNLSKSEQRRHKSARQASCNSFRERMINEYGKGDPDRIKHAEALLDLRKTICSLPLHEFAFVIGRNCGDEGDISARGDPIQKVCRAQKRGRKLGQKDKIPRRERLTKKQRGDVLRPDDVLDSMLVELGKGHLLYEDSDEYSSGENIILDSETL